mgnify:FL=1
MSKFTKTLIASAMAVAVAGPAAADVKDTGAFRGTKTTVKITPSGCPNAKIKDIVSEIGFYPQQPSAGCWSMDLLDYFGTDNDYHVEGGYIERKFGKDLTSSLFEFSADTLVWEMEDYLASESKCDTVDGFIDDAYIKKGNVKISKNGDRAKLDLQVDGEYTNDSGKTKKVKAKVSGKMDFVAASQKPSSFDCDEVGINPPDEQ